MTSNTDKSTGRIPTQREREREQRRAIELRANLRRRKAKAHAEGLASGDDDASGGDEQVIDDAPRGDTAGNPR